MQICIQARGSPWDTLYVNLPTSLSDTTMVMIAKRLHMSRSTLGTSWRAEERRIQLSHGPCTLRCYGHLRRADLSIAEIARFLRYEDISAFHKAFKRWTGRTPAEQRARYWSSDGLRDDVRAARD